jgi:hypothetical protein
MMTCVSSNIVLYGASFVVHSLSGMVRIVICTIYLALIILREHSSRIC